jgi:hypothetical protein
MHITPLALSGEGPDALAPRSINCNTFKPADTVHHGTWVSPEIMGTHIKPHQAHELLAGKLVDHGPGAAVCCSTDLVSPAVQSLLGRSPMWAHRGDRTTIPFVQLMIPAIDGTDYFFTPAAAVGHLVRHNTHGYIYSITPIPESAEDFVDPYIPGNVGEVRIAEDVRWTYAGRTTVADLPDSLLLVDGPPDCLSQLRDASRPVPRMEDPLIFCQAYGLRMRRFADVRGQLQGARSHPVTWAARKRDKREQRGMAGQGHSAGSSSGRWGPPGR